MAVVSLNTKRVFEHTTHITRNTRKEEKAQGVPLLVLANKVDLISALPARELGDALGLAGVRDRRWAIRACCARS